MDDTLDLLIVGAGFAGMQMLHRARGLGLRARVYDAADGVGGTWYWNRYPGCRCDVESLEYSYQFSEELQQDWHWRERYAAQPEILRYANHVADRFDLRRDIVLGTRVAAAHWDEAGKRWRVRTETSGDSGGAVAATGPDDATAQVGAGPTSEVAARFVVMATGALSTASMPKIPGIERFAGRTFHTGRWPHEHVDFDGRRVGVIGTGSSAVQAIPLIAQQAAQLFVFQRTATYSVPARNGPTDRSREAEVKANYAAFRAMNDRVVTGFGAAYPRHPDSALAATPEEHERRFEERWQLGGLYFMGAFGDLILNREANELAAEFVRRKIRETVKDPRVAALLCPTHPIGCKRLCADSGYYETFNRPNVTLVDVSGAPIDAITPEGLSAGGRHYALDDIVYATGFDAMTGTLMRIDVRGRDGLALKDKWAEGPRTWLGLGVAGFPNLFVITGPGSPSVLTNMLVSIHQQVNWIAECVGYLDAHRHATIEARPESEDAWVAHVNAVADATLYPGCNSWYLGANVPGKPRVFMPLLGFPAYADRCAEVAARGYEGFRLGAPHEDQRTAAAVAAP